MQIPSSARTDPRIFPSASTGHRKLDVTLAADLPEEVFAELRRHSQPTESAPPSKGDFAETLSSSVAAVKDEDLPIPTGYGASRQKPVSRDGLGTQIDVIA
ncbi:MAG: hypothetical protein HY709_10095 [Candidatus Latescibacteria bacterium]|nr:hypothetical protein [Candidatus Latescibacterota bacterium]